MAPAKLYYYSATGKGHQIRLALSAANIDFEDIFPNGGYPPNEEQILAWRKIGGNTTTNVPMLQLANGKVYTQSSAVLRVVGRIGNLMPSCDDDLYRMDKLLADAEDFRTESYKSFRSWGASQEAYDRFFNDVLPRHFGNFERQLVENGGLYFVVKDRLTIADVSVYDAVVNFGKNRAKSDCMENFHILSNWIHRVESNPGIATYLSSEKYASIQMKFNQDM